MREPARNPVKSVRKSLRIVEELVERGGAPVTDLSEGLPYSKGTVHNHLSTLREQGYVTLTDGVYRVGLRFLYPGIHARARRDLHEAAADAVAALAETTGERVDLVAAEGPRAVLIGGATGERYGGPSRAVGSRVPLHCTATGKAVLAHRPDADLAAVLAEGTARTDRTITDPGELRTELRRVRDEELASDRGESDPDLRGVAAPLSGAGRVRGAVGVVAPADRMRGKTFQQDVPGLVFDSKERINAALEDY